MTLRSIYFTNIGLKEGAADILSRIASLEPKRREAILNASLKEFAAKGYEDASTNVMAREAGISKALFFHYVNSKKDLFLFLFDYSCKVLEKELTTYQELIKQEKDVFARVRQGVRLKTELLYQKYPPVYAFYKVASYTDSEQFNEYFSVKNDFLLKSGLEQLYEGIDESRFREGIDVQRAVRIIFWASEGFANELHKKINTGKGFRIDRPELDRYWAEYAACLEVLEKSFYR